MSIWKNPKFLGNLIYYLLKLLYKTLRIKVKIDPQYDPKKQYLFAFWHGQQLLPIIHLIKHQTVRVVLTSPSKDGDILATVLKRFGYTVLRGSSRDGNIRALGQMIKVLRNGASLGFGIDGPLGPIYQVKPGMTYLSSKLQIPIIPVTVKLNHKIVLEKAWDKFEIPYPGSTAEIIFGAPILVPPKPNFVEYNNLLNNKLSVP